MKIDKIQIEDGVRMIRFGFGTHHGSWFIRVDLWSIAYRLSFPTKK